MSSRLLIAKMVQHDEYAHDEYARTPAVDS
jgi:hypothetical protein